MENYFPNYRGDSAVQNLASIPSPRSLGKLQAHVGSNKASGSSALSCTALLLYQWNHPLRDTIQSPKWKHCRMNYGFNLPGTSRCKQTLSTREKHRGEEKKWQGKNDYFPPRMCALFILNDLCKHNWQAEKKNRMTGQKWNSKQQEIKCWICTAVGGEWAIFIRHSVLGEPKKLPQFPGGVGWGEAPTFHDDMPCRQNRPRCLPQNC